jgi:hypothetical protein
MTNMPPEDLVRRLPRETLVLFERMFAVKKLFAMLMTMAVAVILGMGTVGCSKKEEKKETKTETTKVTDAGGANKTETKKTETTETKTDAAKKP